MVDKIGEIIAERGGSHGDYEKQGSLSGHLKAMVRTCPKFHLLPTFVQDAIDMILVKISRAIIGEWSFADHWADIAGYSTLVLNWINKNSKEKTE